MEAGKKENFALTDRVQPVGFKSTAWLLKRRPNFNKILLRIIKMVAIFSLLFNVNTLVRIEWTQSISIKLCDNPKFEELHIIGSH